MIYLFNQLKPSRQFIFSSFWRLVRDLNYGLWPLTIFSGKQIPVQQMTFKRAPRSHANLRARDSGSSPIYGSLKANSNTQCRALAVLRPCFSASDFSRSWHSTAKARQRERERECVWFNIGILSTACGQSVQFRILPSTTRSFTNDTTMSKHGRATVRHVWVNLTRHSRGVAWYVWIRIKAIHGEERHIGSPYVLSGGRKGLAIWTKRQQLTALYSCGQRVSAH